MGRRESRGRLAGRARGRKYPYMAQLRVLEGRRPRAGQRAIPKWLTRIQTPLVLTEWRKQLGRHPDAEYRDYLLRGIERGFRIGFRHRSCSCQQAKSNMKSASEQATVVQEYLEKEVRLGRVVGPLEDTAFPTAVVSRFGVIPKNHQPGKWRLIVDLSHPRGASVNDGIEKELCSLKYTSVDEAVRVIRELGPGTQLAKLDIESAYRLIPVHPEDRPLLGMRWEGKLYIDTTLPFGLRSAPKIFNALADALQWIFEQHGVSSVLHYLDDFLILGAPDSDECKRALEMVLQLCQLLGVPVAVHKTEGPSFILVFLGIELDTNRMEIRLPKEKLQRLVDEIAKWKLRQSCTKRELQSLVGQLQHACCVVKAGRSFLRRMIELSTTVREPHYRIRLNKGFQSDLQWWACFLPTWNGAGMMSSVAPAAYSGVITSDASGSWGCGAFSSVGDWFQLKLPESWDHVHITVKELLPIVIGAALWGKHWQGGAVRCRCDNAAVVAVLRSGRSRDERVMHLMRSLFFFLAQHDMSLVAEHIPGVENGAADALSRNDASSFLLQVPSAKRIPAEVPPELLQMLVHQQPDWTSHSWTKLLANFSRKAWQSQRRERTVAVRGGTWHSVRQGN